MDKQSLHEAVKRLALELPFVELCQPFGPEFDVFKIGGKIFILSSELRGIPFVSLESDPQKSPLSQQIRPSTEPEYHMSKKHQISVYPGEEISEALLRDLINDSWGLVVDGLAKCDQKRVHPDSIASQQHIFLTYHFISILVICQYVKLLSYEVFMDIISVTLKRHFIEALNASKKFTPEQAEQIKTLLQYNLSNTNSQPWHFAAANTEEGKARVARSAADNYVFNERRMLDASHVVVFCTRTAMGDAWLKLVVDQGDVDGRFATPEAKAANDKGHKFFTDMHCKGLHDGAERVAKQVYLNVDNFLLGVAALSLDMVPIEGFDVATLDEEFGLKEKGYISLVVVPMGHHDVRDFNATLLRPRLPRNITLTEM